MSFRCAVRAVRGSSLEATAERVAGGAVARGLGGAGRGPPGASSAGCFLLLLFCFLELLLQGEPGRFVLGAVELVEEAVHLGRLCFRLCKRLLVFLFEPLFFLAF